MPPPHPPDRPASTQRPDDALEERACFEAGEQAGQVLLVLGAGAPELVRAALEGAARAPQAGSGSAPQCYVSDPDEGRLQATRAVLAAGAAPLSPAFLFRGSARRLLHALPVTPSLVLVDGDGASRGAGVNLDLLAPHLAAGTLVLVLARTEDAGVLRGVERALRSGRYEALGRVGRLHRLGRAASLEAAPPRPQGLDGTVYARLCALGSAGAEGACRRELHAARVQTRGSAAQRLASGRAAWPYAPDPSQPPLPATLPDGRPWPRISVVTPSYNQGRFLEETLLSVLHQGYPDVELLVIDGGSTDETPSVLERYRSRLAHVESAKDRGQGDAINKGFARATGDVLTWLNSDDMLAPGALAAAAAALVYSGADLVAGEVHVVRDGRLEHRHLTSCGDGPLPLDELLDVERCWIAGQFFFQPEVFFTRALWHRTGGGLDLGLRYSLDYELWVRMAAVGARLCVIGRPLTLFRAHDEQKTAETAGGGYRAELPRVREALLARLGRAPVAHGPAQPRARLRVVLFNDIGYLYGAGIAHRRLADALRGAGHEVHVLRVRSPQPCPEVPEVDLDALPERLRTLEPDLVVVGNLHGTGMDVGVLSGIAAEHETVFMLHDLWLLTGRCAYTGTCREYLEGCGSHCTCPPGHPELPAGAVAPAWNAKRELLGSAPRLTLWANSRWSLDRVQEALDRPCQASRPRRPPVAHLRLGIETDVFAPRDKLACRDALGLPRERFLVLSSASSLADVRKGLAYLAEALRLLNLPDLDVVCLGAARPDEQHGIARLHTLGYVHDANTLATCYAAADLFVGPSLEEAFGQVFLEAAACGTPSIGFPVGGVPEAILDGWSGRVATRVSAEALADAIDELYCDAELRRSMGVWGRLWVEGRHSLAAAYHSVARALWDTGVAERLSLARKIDLTGASSTLVGPTTPLSRAGQALHRAGELERQVAVLENRLHVLATTRWRKFGLWLGLTHRRSWER